MGESITVASHDEDKMGEVAKTYPALEVSVSFGRFENDSLSWEKWSSFSTNKYLEEVEKCATPGSVAQKKAYFEAHYRKIAARKAEKPDQKQMEHDSLSSEGANGEDLINKICGTDSGFDTSNSQNSSEGVTQETKLDTNHLDDGHVDEPNKHMAIDGEIQDSLEVRDSVVEKVKEELEHDTEVQDSLKTRDSMVEKVKEEVVDKRQHVPTLNKPKEVYLVKEVEIPSMGSQHCEELPKNLEKEMQNTWIIKEENARSDNQKESQKITQMSKVKDVARVKKKLEPPVTKVPQVSTPKISKPASSSGAVSASRSSTMKVTGSSFPQSKHPSVGENKKVAPKSLHMSLSLDPSSSAPASLTTPRKSFSMEKMGDKDIVKRAFKTFQNNLDQLKSSAMERSLKAKQAPRKEREVKVSTPTPRKENGGSLKTGGMDKKAAKSAPSSFSLKSEESAEKVKEFPKKLQRKEAENTRLQTKLKIEKEADVRKLRQSLNFKATPLPSFYRTGQRVSKSPLDKVNSKTLRI